MCAYTGVGFLFTCKAKREKGKTFSIETSQYDMLRKPSEIDKGRLPSNHQASPMLEDLVKSVLLKSPLLSILFA